MIITLQRDIDQPAPTQCQLGILTVNGRKFHTIERPLATEGIGCIPAGEYRCEAQETEARGKHWQLSNPALFVYRYPSNVPRGQHGYSQILIHAATWARELQSCIAPGKSRMLGRDGEWMVTESRAAMNELRTLMGNQFDIKLIIGGADISV